MIFLRSPRVGSVALRSECCGGKFQVGGGLVDTLGDGVTGGRVEVGTTRERFSSGRGDGIWDAGAPAPGGAARRRW